MGPEGFRRCDGFAGSVPQNFINANLPVCPLCGSHDPYWTLKDKFELTAHRMLFRCQHCGGVLSATQDDFTGATKSSAYNALTTAGLINSVSKKKQGKDVNTVYLRIEDAGTYQASADVVGREMPIEEFQRMAGVPAPAPAGAPPVYQQPQPVYQQPVYQAPPQPVYQQPVYQPQPVYRQPVTPLSTAKPKLAVASLAMIIIVTLYGLWNMVNYLQMGYPSNYMLNQVLFVVANGLMIAGICLPKNGKSPLFAAGLFLNVLVSLISNGDNFTYLSNRALNGELISMVSILFTILIYGMKVGVGAGYIVGKKPLATTVKQGLAIGLIVLTVLMKANGYLVFINHSSYYSSSMVMDVTFSYFISTVMEALFYLSIVLFTPAKE